MYMHTQINCEVIEESMWMVRVAVVKGQFCLGAQGMGVPNPGWWVGREHFLIYG